MPAGAFVHSSCSSAKSCNSLCSRSWKRMFASGVSIACWKRSSSPDRSKRPLRNSVWIQSRKKRWIGPSGSQAKSRAMATLIASLPLLPTHCSRLFSLSQRQTISRNCRRASSLDAKEASAVRVRLRRHAERHRSCRRRTGCSGNRCPQTLRYHAACSSLSEARARWFDA